MRRIFMFFTLCLTVLLPVTAVAQIYDPAEGWDKLFNTWLWISIFIWLVVTIPMIYFLFKYKRKKEGEDGAYITGNIGLEALWIIVPIIITIFLGVQAWGLLNKYRNVPQGAYEVRIDAFQYAFEMNYNEGIKVLNELRVPMGPVKLLMTSRDVVHNFAIPQFRVREDIIPGRMTYLWFNAKEPGEYNAYCAELCGPGHSKMLAKVIVMETDDFKEWTGKYREKISGLSPEERGAELIDDLGCIGCHSMEDEDIAPTFRGLFGKEREFEDGKKAIADEAYIKESIGTPEKKVVKGFDPIMPDFSLSKEDMDAIISYIKTL